MKYLIKSKENNSKRKPRNFHRSVFSTSQNVFLLEENKEWETFKTEFSHEMDELDKEFKKVI